MPDDHATTSSTRPGWALLGEFTRLLLLAVALPVLVLVGLLLWQLSLSVHAQHSSRLAATATASARELDGLLRVHLAAMQVLADRRIANDDIGDIPRWKTDLARVSRHYPAFAHLLVTDAEGDMLIESPALPEGADRSVADREYFQVPRETTRGHVSGVYRGRGPDRAPRVAVAVPLLRDDAFAGVLAGSMHADALVPAHGLEEHGFELLLLDRELTVVQSSDGMAQQPLHRLDARDGPLPERDLARVARGSSLVRQLDGVLGDGGDALVVSVPLDNGWRLLVLEPRRMLDAEMRRTAAALLGLLALVLGGVLLVIVVRMRRLRRSVSGLLRRMRQFALDSDSDQVVPGRMPRELRPLADAMNALAARARASYDEVSLSLQEQRRLREELQTVAQRLLTVQEDERRTLSRELHDDIGQSITAIKLAATSLTDPSLGDDPATRREILDEVIAIADQTVHKLRDLSLLLRPPQLDSLGLEPALRGQVALLTRNSRLRIDLDVATGGERLPAEVELACFRIAQEALTNVVRHAAATAARVEVALEGQGAERTLLLRVTDDGRGIDPSRGNGLGMLTMRERAAQLGGSVAVSARPGGGTEVVARLPAGQAD
ncbi:ATP-binding protein [Luteimonas sp. J29]|jgi:signal transduction histidine kinase|uniref:ATP-binding protein n=1 Tax=Luteimonas sp. J29 TaxID=935863 RepID=UPI00047A9E72|nr:ATP-binding protein [Luteimonas sp. J29]